MKRRAFLASVGAAVPLAGCLSAADVGGSEAPEPVVELPVETDDMWRVRKFSTVALERARYYNRSEDALDHVEPDNGLFFQQGLAFENLGGWERELPAPDRFQMEVGGERYERIEHLNGVGFHQQRTEDEAEFSEAEVVPEAHPGESGYVAPLFDIPADSDRYLRWDHDTVVDGHESPVYFDLND
ncbi:hypothetical protein [Haloparvum sedimenti]|uniref:hypothetical protein n=1 Tax=Haloparvum sedimenti TaxID=1678448 RepID=UPI00071E7001|nr:hypothetical protein [Haloparvum sedimenti]